jgi:hypothetical protein
MLREVKGLVRINAITRDGDLDYIRWKSRRGQKAGYGKRWRLVRRLRWQRYVEHLHKLEKR